MSVEKYFLENYWLEYIGSGGMFAQSAAKALLKYSKLNAREIVEEAMDIAQSVCVYTNSNLTIEEL